MHCSDSDNPAHDDIDVIRAWHTERGFIGPDGKANTEDDVGYHFFICKDGRLQQGRYTNDVGAHCEGHNHDSIGVCLSGRNKFSPAQFTRLKRLVAELMAMYKIKRSNVYPHNYFNKSKSCPNFDLESALKS